MDNATKRPWKFGKTFGDTKMMILDGSGDYVCSVQIEQTPRAYGRHDEERRKTNAALIVTAVNQHAALLRCAEALEPFGELSKFCIKGVDSISYPMDVADIQRARSALARLKGDSA